MKTLNQSERILTLLQDYRILTVELLYPLLNSSPQMVRKWLRPLTKKKKIKKLSRTSVGRGRPPQAFSLFKDEFKPMFLEHQLALNMVRIQFECMPFLTCSFLPYLSSLSKISVPLSPQGGIQRDCIPDGVFVLSKEDKVLLFFLEIDRGTEPLKAKKEGATDILEKLDMYRVLFATKKYKRFEKAFNCSFKGFRMLLVSTSPARHESLCRLVASEPYCDFMWLTDIESLISQGVHAAVWAKGGVSDYAVSLLKD